MRLIGLVLVPFLTAQVDVLACGKRMAERHSSALQRAKSDNAADIREVADKSPAEEIADANALLNAGTINQGEFDRLKEKALA